MYHAKKSQRFSFSSLGDAIAFLLPQRSLEMSVYDHALHKTFSRTRWMQAVFENSSICVPVSAPISNASYFLTAANPNPFGPTCVPMTVVTLTINMSRGTD